MPKVKHMHWMKWMWSSLDWLVCSANPITHSFPSSYGVNHYKGWLSCSRTSQFCSHPTTASNAFEELVFWLWPFLPDHFHIEISLSITMNIFFEFGSSGKRVRYRILKKNPKSNHQEQSITTYYTKRIKKKTDEQVWGPWAQAWIQNAGCGSSNSWGPRCPLKIGARIQGKNQHLIAAGVDVCKVVRP